MSVCLFRAFAGYVITVTTGFMSRVPTLPKWADYATLASFTRWGFQVGDRPFSLPYLPRLHISTFPPPALPSPSMYVYNIGSSYQPIRWCQSSLPEWSRLCWIPGLVLPRCFSSDGLESSDWSDCCHSICDFWETVDDTIIKRGCIYRERRRRGGLMSQSGSQGLV